MPVRSQSVFVYGSLKRGYGLHHLLQGQEFVGCAVTQPRYRLFNIGEYPGLVDWPEGLSIHGEIYRVDSDCLARLDEAEGVSERMYSRRTIDLQCEFPDQDIHAWFWLRAVRGLTDCGVRWPVSDAANSP